MFIVQRTLRNNPNDFSNLKSSWLSHLHTQSPQEESRRGKMASVRAERANKCADSDTVAYASVEGVFETNKGS